MPQVRRDAVASVWHEKSFISSEGDCTWLMRRRMPEIRNRKKRKHQNRTVQVGLPMPLCAQIPWHIDHDDMRIAF